MATIGEREARSSERHRTGRPSEPTIWETRDGQQILVFADPEQAENWYPDAYVESRPIWIRELTSVMTWYPGGVLRAASMSINWSFGPVLLQFAAVALVYVVQLVGEGVRRATTQKE